MHIDITGNHVELTQPLKDHVHKKFVKINEKFPHITKIHVILSVENGFEHKAEGIMHVCGGKKSGDIIAHATTEDMYTSITQLSKKLQTQILEHKARLQDHDKDTHH